MKRVSKAVAAGIAAAMMCTAMVSAAAQEHLNFGCYMYAASFDPAAYQNAAWQGMRLGVTEALFRFNDDMTVSGCLCDTYEVSEDHKTWTLHIRDGVKFSNGNDCNAQAVADSLQRLYNVCAREEYSSTPSTYIDMASITADEEANTVTLVTNAAYADLTATLCFPFYTIIDVEGDLDDESHDYTESVIGTGPYVVDSFDVTTKNAELVRNENYWKGEVPYASVSATFIEDDTTKALAIQSGDIDLTENVTTASDLATLEADDTYYVSKTSSMRTGFAYLNFAGVLGNDDLRRAVCMAVDGQTLCDVTVGGMYTYGYAVLPSSLVYDYDSLVYAYGYDVEGAKKLLDDAGIVDTDGDGIRELNGENITLRYITYVNRCLSDFAEAIQVSLAEIGINVEITNTDSDTEWNLMQAGAYDLCDSNWTTVGTGDPTAFLLNWYGDGGANLYDGENAEATNYCNYVSEEYDKLYETFTASTDVEERNRLVAQMEQVLLDDCAVLVHGYYNSSFISNATKVTGAEISTIDYYWLSSDIKPVE